MRNTVLSVKNIIKRFSGVIALKDVSMDLYDNEILAVMGENGAGKSTLMKILSGIYPKGSYEGSILINNEEVSFRSPFDSEASGIAMIYQELNLELDLSVAENILLGRYPRNKRGFIDWNEVNIRAQQVLDMLHIDIDISVNVRNLSPSLQQLVSIAHAIYRNPKILILDEPTSVLTESETQKLMKILESLKEKGIACIYISHKLDEVFKLCDRMVILRDGYYISTYHKDKGYDSAAIIEDMIGRKLDVMYPTIEKEIGKEVLRVENFTVPHPYAYGKNIIDDASFTLHKGEILGLAGLVGAGRSELVSAIFGYLPKKNGKVYFEGNEINIKNPTDAINKGIGFLSEDRKKNGFVWSMSIKENMTLTILKDLKKGLFMNDKIEHDITKKYFKELQIKAPSLNTIISTLSGGNQQKVILAKWLMTNLKVLMLDEPTRGIDVGTKSEIYKLINELAKKGISIIMISSELPELVAMCDRFVVLGKGIVQKEFKKGEVSEVDIMRAASCT